MTADLHEGHRTRNDIPWPGPRPFTEREARLFYGRRSEVREIVLHVLHNRLNVVSARSGVGKTSVIRAGVIPALHLTRNRTAGSTGLPGPLPVCVRDWWEGAPRSPEQSFVNALSSAIRKLVEWKGDPLGPSDEDIKALLRLQAAPPKGAADYVSALCDAAGEVVLILDQFEEILRWPVGTSDAGPLDLVERIYAREAAGSTRRARILLSLREEAHVGLRLLERRVGGLQRSTYHLGAMSRNTAREAILGPATGTDWMPEEAFVESLLDWLGSPAAAPGAASHVASSTLANVWGEPFAGARLLGLQALLYELACETLDEKLQVRRTIGLRLAREYLDNVPFRFNRKEVSEVESFVGRAFLGSVERAFSGWVPQPSIRSPGASRGELQALAKRLAALVSPELYNPAGYKIARLHEDLVASAVAPDKRMLLPDRRRGTRGGASPEHEQAGERVSGLARRRQLRPQTVLKVVKEVAAQTLDRLAGQNLLKSYAGEGASAMYELQHDGLGPWLTRWASLQRESVEFDMASQSSLRGESFAWKSLHKRKFDNLNWRGCEFEGHTFDEVEFEDCNFSGCYFTSCTFRRTTFRRCTMNGVVFRHGTVAGPDTGQGGGPGLLLDQVDAQSILLTGLKVDGTVAIQKAKLDGMTLDDCRINGQLLVTESNVVLASLTRLRSDGTTGQPAVRLINCVVALSVIENMAPHEGFVVVEPALSEENHVLGCTPYAAAGSRAIDHTHKARSARRGRSNAREGRGKPLSGHHDDLPTAITA